MTNPKLKLLVQIAQMLRQDQFQQYQVQLQDLQSKLVNNEISVDNANKSILKMMPFEIYNNWWSIISKKPIHKSLVNVMNDRILNDDELAKIASSMITQLIIHKISNNSIDLSLLYFDELLDLLNTYSQTGHVSLKKFKSIINVYKEIGLIKEENTDVSSNSGQ